ncbi:conjugal transfer protein TrbB [Aurantimicrobium minutum]|uniref:Conjugal transfer protein TrbB n=1 Tax=Aurantimicrobium minutum TaxID=708131 RepID=A0A173LVD4_9MICO|nr:conjugal transfer protein TrbB [Aurantimicrobium minutum]
MGMPVFVGSGLGAELDTATKTTNAITITAASALTMIQGSLDEAGLGVGADTVLLIEKVHVRT